MVKLRKSAVDPGRWVAPKRFPVAEHIHKGLVESRAIGKRVQPPLVEIVSDQLYSTLPTPRAFPAVARCIGTDMII